MGALVFHFWVEVDDELIIVLKLLLKMSSWIVMGLPPRHLTFNPEECLFFMVFGVL